jgi:tetratricopeptide (TPR) repeat protein
MISSFRPRLIRPRVAGIAASAALLVAASYAATWVARQPSSAPARPAAPVEASLPPPDAPPAGRSELLLARFDGAIKAWNANVTSNAGDYISATNLGTVYLGRARLTGNLADYQQALSATTRALDINAAYPPARGLHASVLFALHDFGGALAEARSLHADDAGNLQALALIGDASLELGDLDAARDAYRRLGNAAAAAPVWSRTAHLAFIEGDLERAIALVQQAVDAVDGEPPSEMTAFYAFQLGELYRAAGDIDAAAAAYDQALNDLPDYVPATAGLARVREAQGRRDEAIQLLRAATARLPQPDLLATLGDLYALDGDARAAEQQYALVDRIGELAAATGSVYDRQLVLFAADHDRGVSGAVDRARAELEVRPDVYGHDALAWALFKAGRLDEAAGQADAALALGTPDPRLSYHAGMIAAAQGRTADARRLLTQALDGAVYLPPLQVPVVEQALTDLMSSADR